MKSAVAVAVVATALLAPSSANAAFCEINDFDAFPAVHSAKSGAGQTMDATCRRASRPSHRAVLKLSA